MITIQLLLFKRENYNWLVRYRIYFCLLAPLMGLSTNKYCFILWEKFEFCYLFMYVYNESICCFLLYLIFVVYLREMINWIIKARAYFNRCVKNMYFWHWTVEFISLAVHFLKLNSNHMIIYLIYITYFLYEQAHCYEQAH